MAVLFERYQDAMNFRPERFNPIPLAGNSRVKVILACFEPGQFIPVHRPGVDLTLVILQGEGGAHRWRPGRADWSGRDRIYPGR
jgi:quercetin dioxygenase-like cupin family protein